MAIDFVGDKKMFSNFTLFSIRQNSLRMKMCCLGYIVSQFVFAKYCFTICVCEILFHNLSLRNIVSQFGNDFDDFLGDVNFDDLSFCTPKKHF